MIDVEARLKRMQDQLEELDDTLDDEVRAGIDREESDARRMKAQLESVVDMEFGRVDEMRMRVQRLEDELANGRNEIIILDEQLQELLQ